MSVLAIAYHNVAVEQVRGGGPRHRARDKLHAGLSCNRNAQEFLKRSPLALQSYGKAVDTAVKYLGASSRSRRRRGPTAVTRPRCWCLQGPRTASR